MKLPFITRFADRIVNRVSQRPPDIVIGGRNDPYMNRWYVLPRNRWFNVYLHHFVRSDDDRALHDHPWVSCSVILTRGYIEHVPRWPSLWPTVRETRKIHRRPGEIVFRKASDPHRIELYPDVDSVPVSCWTLFLTGPRIRSWGFWCEKGWRHWKIFTAVSETGDSSRIGRGCD